MGCCFSYEASDLAQPLLSQPKPAVTSPPVRFTAPFSWQEERNVNQLAHLIYVLFNARNPSTVVDYVAHHYADDYRADGFGPNPSFKEAIVPWIFATLFANKCRLFNLDIFYVSSDRIDYSVCAISELADGSTYLDKSIDSMTFNNKGQFQHCVKLGSAAINDYIPNRCLQPFTWEEERNVKKLAHLIYVIFNSRNPSPVVEYVTQNYADDYRADGFGPKPSYKEAILPWIFGTLFPIKCRLFDLDVYFVSGNRIEYSVRSVSQLANGSAHFAVSVDSMTFNNKGQFQHCVKLR